MLYFFSLIWDAEFLWIYYSYYISIILFKSFTVINIGKYVKFYSIVFNVWLAWFTTNIRRNIKIIRSSKYSITPIDSIRSDSKVISMVNMNRNQGVICHLSRLLRKFGYSISLRKIANYSDPYQTVRLKADPDSR